MADQGKMLYEKHKKLSQTETSVWSRFLKASDNLSAKCMYCNKIIKTSGGSTSGLHTHLKTTHSIVLKHNIDSNSQRLATTSTANISSFATTEDETQIKRTKLTDYFTSSNSLPETLSRMTSVDGLPFSFFITSNDQRRVMARSGYKLPTSSNSIKNIVMKHGETVKLSLINILKKMKIDGVKVSVTLDEWTSLSNRRFMNVNVHSPMLNNNFVNLGLVRVIGSMPARTCLQLLEKRLLAFELSLKDDVICTTTDGASVMVAFGRDASIFHQQCLAHGIQLAILDVLYKNNENCQSRITETEVDENSHNFASDDDEDDNDGFHVIVRTNQNNEFIFKELTEKVRKISKLFRKSPTKNDLLQKYVKEEMVGEINLILDCRTRWNSLADMLERFLKLKIPIQKALIDLKIDQELSENEYRRLADLSRVFEILKATVEELCKRTANLITADAALKFMFKKLDAMHHESVVPKLVTSLKRRIKERRLLVASTLNYLHNPKTYFESANEYCDVFLRPDCTEMRKHIADVVKMKENSNLESTLEVTVSAQDDKNDDSPSVPLKKQLEMAVKKQMLNQNNISIENSTDFDTLIKIEMALYENGGSRGKYLSMAFNNLISIPPTSVESERAFSSSGYLCNHLRSRLSDKSLDTLLFLRSHYNAQPKI